MPCASVETTTTKNTVLKIVLSPAIPAESAKVASTIGTAPRRPAQERKSCSRQREAKRSQRDDHGQRPGHEDEHGCERERGPGDGAELAREDEQAEHDEENDLGEEGEAFVEARRSSRAAASRVLPTQSATM